MRIGTTEKTVKVHRGRVMQKLAVPSLAELIRLVDRLRSEPDRTVVRLDGMEIERPRAVEIIIRTMARARGEAMQAAAASTDGRAMHLP
jgi:hypothetical protein